MRVAPLVAGLLTWIPGSLALAGAPEQPSEWLLRVSEGGRHATYRGVVVYRGEDMLESLRISHRFKDGREQEHVSSLTGSPREVIREDDHVVCVRPHEAAGRFAAPSTELFPGMTRDTLKQVAAQYDFKALGQTRVAGRLVRGVAVVPHDQFRYGYEVWADAANAVPLKVSLVDARGRTVEQLMFTEVDFSGVVPDSEFAVPASEREPPAPAVAQPASAQNVAPGVWILDKVPAGFKVTMRVTRPLPGNNGMVEHMLLSDGLSAVSVFSVGAQMPQRAYQGLSHMGATHAYGRAVGAFHVTVVGEVPQETVRLIGDGLRPAAGASNEPGN